MTARFDRRRAGAILWLDSGAGLAAGATVLLTSHWLARVHEVAPGLVVMLGVTNVVYGSYSGLLATFASVRGRLPPRRAIEVLVAANLGWTCVCIGLVAKVASTASIFFLGHVAFEGAFVAALAAAEWLWVRPGTAALRG